MKEEYLKLLVESEEKLQNETEKLNKILDGSKYIKAEEIDNIAINIPKRIKFKIFFDFKVIFAYLKYKKNFNIKCSNLYNIKSNIRQHINESNDKYILTLVDNFKIQCLPIEGKTLDFNQINSIIREDRNSLIVAGAGTGKTTTIIGRVKYLIKCLYVNPNEILLLSFTNSSASEMKERVEKETGLKIDTFTFHKLGLDIIKKTLNKNYNIFDKSLAKFIKIELEENIKNNDYLTKIIYLLTHLKYLDKDEFDFKNEEEYKEFLSYNLPITLKGEEVKSYGELEIANYLYRNGINYIYESKYKIDTTTLDFREYRPDFFLPDYNLYIEYFGIDKDDNVAPYFKGKDGKTASQIYNESIEWKRKIHKENHTNMIELFYYQNKEGKLISNLETQLEKHNVEKYERNINELWNEITQNNHGVLEEIAKMLETIINLIKSNNYSFEEFKKVILVDNNKYNRVIVDIIEPVYNSYNKYLNDNDLIDFNDMINKASELVHDNKYIHSYKYVIVDEYQDISYARYNLLKQLRKQKDYKLFCVGDDFQSIYRFSGSDINLFVDFEKYWGNSYIGKIENAYRYTKELADISGKFIMKNPRQIVKRLNGITAERYPLSEIIGYNEEYLVRYLENKLQELKENSTVFLIGRYSFDINFIVKSKMFNMKYNNATKMVDVLFYKRKDLKITFLTAHRSKGLQADYAIIINNKNRGLGFPSKIQDLSIINKLLSDVDEYPYSEERRLFYVAMTRSKLKTILLVLDNNKSLFIKELEEMYGKELKREHFECPKCGHRLISKTGKYGKFLGCSNYPDCTYIRK